MQCIIAEFIHQLSIQDQLKPFDIIYIKQLRDAIISPQTVDLTFDQNVLIRSIFKDRFEKVTNSEDDYTTNPSEINKCWIGFSQQLATLWKTNYIDLLFPCVTNKLDPVSLKPLAAYLNPYEFYWEDNEKTLNHISGLFSRGLLRQPLAIFQDTNHLKPRALSIYELHSIRHKKFSPIVLNQICRQEYALVYQNIWDILLNEAVPKWTSKGKSPSNLISCLYDCMNKCLEDYFIDKEPHTELHEKRDSSVRSHFKPLASMVYRCSLANVYHFYGQCINVAGKNRYLIELILELLDNDTFELNDTLKAMAIWLSQYDPQWKDSLSKQLDLSDESSKLKIKADMPLMTSEIIEEDHISSPLKISTVLMLKALYEQSFYKNGLYQEYFPEQEKAAAVAYCRYYEEAHRLPQDEKIKLNEQWIAYKTDQRVVWWRFGNDVIGRVRQGCCVAVQGRYVGKLVKDFGEPLLMTNDELPSSSKRVLAEYDNIDHKVALKRVLMIALSLMTQSFNSLWSNPTIHFWDCSNQVSNDILKCKIWDYISPLLENDNIQDARFVYSSIMAWCIKPEVENKWWVSRIFQPGMSKWLDEIVNETLFDNPNAWYHSVVLLKALLPMAKADRLPSITKLVDDILKTCCQQKHDSLKELRINIIFIRFLRTLPTSLRGEVLRRVSEMEKMGTDKSSDSITCEWLIFRVAQVGISVKKSGSSHFFKNDPPPSHCSIIKNALEKCVNPQGSVSQNVEIIERNISKLETLSDDERTRINRYLKMITHRIMPILRSMHEITPASDTQSWEASAFSTFNLGMST